MATAITYDREPGFIADVLEIKGETICVLSPAVATDANTQAVVQRFMEGHGIDCRTCGGCPVGTALQEGGDGRASYE